MERAYHIGLGPHPRRITHPARFGRLANFYLEIDAHHTLKRSAYEHWTLHDALTYVQETAQVLATDSSMSAVRLFAERAAAGEGPSAEVLTRQTGLILGQLLDRVGYPDIRRWEAQDFIDWGVRFTLANNRVPYHDGFCQLSAKRRGPGHATITARFGSITHYKELVQAAYQEELDYRAALQQEQLELVKADLEAGTLPATLVDQAPDSTMVIRWHAHWQVVTELLPDLSPSKVLEVTQVHSGGALTNGILRNDPNISAGEVELVAEELGVMDTIWPPEDYTASLKVTPANRPCTYKRKPGQRRRPKASA